MTSTFKILYPGICTVSLLLYLMVLKTISPGCGVQASLMLFFLFFSVSECNQRLLLYTLFGMSLKYQSVDISLAVSCGLVPLLHQLCGQPESLLEVMTMVVYSRGVSSISTLLKVAGYRLWQIIAISTGSVIWAYFMAFFCYLKNVQEKFLHNSEFSLYTKLSVSNCLLFASQ